jgi:hypothetical protein
MAGQIVSKELILAEFDRLKDQAYEFSDAELCIIVAANTQAAIEAVQHTVAERETTPQTA